MKNFHGVLALVVTTSGCTTVGTGDRTLVKDCVSDQGLHNTFSEFTIMGCGADTTRLVALTPGANVDETAYETYLKERGMAADRPIVELNATIREKDSIPTLVNEQAFKDINLAITKVELDEKLSEAQKERMITTLRAKLLNAPRMDAYTTQSGEFAGVNLYDYFPRLEADFSARLMANNELDNFKQLGIVIKINEDSARFVDYAPKEASIVDFTRGTLVQTGALGVTSSVTDAVTDTLVAATGLPGPNTATATDSQVLTRNGGTTMSLSEAFTNQLVDALEQQVTGILDGGKIFFASYKSTRNKRISGTYSYDLMVHVPSKPEVHLSGDQPLVATGCQHSLPLQAEMLERMISVASVPCAQSITADIYLVGVARLVEDRGFSGVFNRVPEIENDDVYEHVVASVLKDVPLWNLSRPMWIDTPVRETSTLTINTNLDGAQFGIYEKSGGTETLVAVGNGKRYNHVYQGQRKDFVVKFMDVVTESEGNSIVYVPKTLSVDVGQSSQIVAEYNPKRE